MILKEYKNDQTFHFEVGHTPESVRPHRPDIGHSWLLTNDCIASLGGWWRWTHHLRESGSSLIGRVFGDTAQFAGTTVYCGCIANSDLEVETKHFCCRALGIAPAQVYATNKVRRGASQLSVWVGGTYNAAGSPQVRMFVFGQWQRLSFIHTNQFFLGKFIPSIFLLNSNYVNLEANFPDVSSQNERNQRFLPILGSICYWFPFLLLF